jgi:hypothetical protein
MASGRFLTEEEYKADIYELFCPFDFDTPKDAHGRPADPDAEQLLDLHILELIFKALQRPLNAAESRRVTKKMDENNLVGIPYPDFEAIYLGRFPYDAFGPDAFGIGIPHVERALRDANAAFSDAQLAGVAATCGDRGKLTLATLEALFPC